MACVVNRVPGPRRAYRIVDVFPVFQVMTSVALSRPWAESPGFAVLGRALGADDLEAPARDEPEQLPIEPFAVSTGLHLRGVPSFAARE